MISRWLKALGAEGLCVARAGEGQELRDSGIPGPIALLTPFLPEQAVEVVRADLEPVVCRRDQIEALAAIDRPKPTPIHIKIDTGMSRVGVVLDEAAEFCRWAQSQKGVAIRGLCSHFATADERDKSFSQLQMDRFFDLANSLRESGVKFEHMHIANSAAIMDLPDSWSTLVRPGIMTYGLEPSIHVKLTVDLQPVMALKTRVLLVKHIPAGAGVSYGLTWVAPDRVRIATLPIGYADGLPRIASSKGEMIVRRRRVAQIGRICMDLTMIDVTLIEGVAVGDEVVVWGRQGDEQVHVDEWAQLCGTINYEMTTRLGPRVPRIPV
jgi:alanine racemase